MLATVSRALTDPLRVALHVARAVTSRLRAPRRSRFACIAGQASVLLVGGLAALLVGVLCWARWRAVWRGRRVLSARRILRLLRAPGRCTRPTAAVRAGGDRWSPESAAPVSRGVSGTRAHGGGTRRARERRRHATVDFPDGESFAPVRIRVGVREVVEVRQTPSGGAYRST